MTRYVTEAQLSKAVDRLEKSMMQFLSEADAPKFKGQSKTGNQSKTEKFAGEAKLVEALRFHYELGKAERFHESELANASYQKFGKANLRNLMLTWGIQNKQPSVKEFVGNKMSKNLRNTWWNTKK